MCTLRESPDQGRYVVALPELTAPLPAGTVVCSSPVHAVAVMETWRKRVCARCFTVAAKRLECYCTICGQAFYCSDACRDDHAARGSPGTSAHTALCPALATFGSTKKFGKEDVAMLRLMLELVAREVLSPALDGTPDRKDLCFDMMQRHPPDWGDKERRDWDKLFSLLEKALTQCDWWRAVPSTVARDWQHMLSRIDSNVFGCFSNLNSGHLFGQGMYLEAAFFNHSCNPNCAVSTAVSPLTVVTTRVVQPGEELSIAYVDISQPPSARQAKLSMQYRFSCACTRCESHEDELTQAGDHQTNTTAEKPSKIHGNATTAAQKQTDLGQKKGRRTKAELRARREERQRAAAAAQQRREALRQELRAPAAEPAVEPEALVAQDDLIDVRDL